MAMDLAQSVQASAGLWKRRRSLRVSERPVVVAVHYCRLVPTCAAQRARGKKLRDGRFVRSALS